MEGKTMRTVSGRVSVEEIGRGCSSLAHAIICDEDQQARVLKIIYRTTTQPTLHQQVQHEVSMIQALQPTNCVPRLFGVLAADDYPASMTYKIVIDNAGMGLRQWIYDQAQKAPSGIGVGHHLYLKVLDRVIEVVNRIHAIGVCHNDINETNIRALGDQPTIKVIDFDRAVWSESPLHRRRDLASAATAVTEAIEAVFGEHWYPSL